MKAGALKEVEAPQSMKVVNDGGGGGCCLPQWDKVPQTTSTSLPPPPPPPPPVRFQGTHLDHDAVHGAVEHAVLDGEALDPRGLALGVFGSNGLLELDGDLARLVTVHRAVVEGSNGLVRGLLAALAEEQTGRLGEENGTAHEEQAPRELQADGDAPRGVTADLVCRKVDNVGEEEARDNLHLVHDEEGAADLLGRGLANVQRDDGGEGADAEAGEEAPDGELDVAKRRGLDHRADCEDGAPEHDRVLAPEAVGRE